jgi:hypothetical protein
MKENKEFLEFRIVQNLKGLMKRPTSFEQKIIDLIEERNYPFKYVGDGKLIICYKNPDFVNSNGEKLLIETYFSKWHIKNYEENRSKLFGRYGFRVLFLNEQDLERKNWKEICSKKIDNFLEVKQI